MTTNRNILAERFRDLAVFLAAGLLPVLMVVSNRSSTAVFTCAAVSMAVSLVLSGEAAAAGARLRQLLRGSGGIIGIVFALWAFVSIAWSPGLRESLFSFGEAALPVVCLLVLAAAPARRPPAWLGKVAVGALLLTLIGIAAELKDGLLMRQLFSHRVFAYTLNRPTIVLLLMAIPCIGFLARSGRRVAAVLLGLATAAVIYLSDSGAATFGMITAIPAFILAVLLPRGAARLMLVLAVLTLLAAPAIGTLASRVMPARAFDEIESSHPRERVAIWLGFGDAALQRPAIGAGFDASPNMPKSPIAAMVKPEHRLVLGWGHPHDAFLQIWVELGLPGVVMAAIALLLLFRWLQRMPSADRPYRLAAAAAVITIAVVSHGAWQGWWFAAIGAEIFLFGQFARLLEAGAAGQAGTPGALASSP